MSLYPPPDPPSAPGSTAFAAAEQSSMGPPPSAAEQRLSGGRATWLEEGVWRLQGSATAECPHCHTLASFAWELPDEYDFNNGPSAGMSGTHRSVLALDPDGSTQRPRLATARGRCSLCQKQCFAEVSHQRGTRVVTAWRQTGASLCRCTQPPETCRCYGPLSTMCFESKEHRGRKEATALALTSRLQFSLDDAVRSLEAWYAEGSTRIASVERALAAVHGSATEQLTAVASASTAAAGQVALPADTQQENKRQRLASPESLEPQQVAVKDAISMLPHGRPKNMYWYMGLGGRGYGVWSPREPPEGRVLPPHSETASVAGAGLQQDTTAALRTASDVSRWYPGVAAQVKELCNAPAAIHRRQNKMDLALRDCKRLITGRDGRLCKKERAWR